MNKKFSVHKIWFHYDDSHHFNNGLAESIGVFDILEEAINERKKLDIEAFKNDMHDCYHFLEDFYYITESRTISEVVEIEKKLIEYAKTQNWDNSIEIMEFNDRETIQKLRIPRNATDIQISKILELTNVSFYEIIEYKDVKEYVYVKLNYDFWGKKVFDKLKKEGKLESRSPFMEGYSNKGFYLIYNPLVGRKSAKFPSFEEASDTAIKIFLECILEFPDNNFLGKTYLEEWTNQSDLFLAYLSNCEVIELISQEITSQNLKAYSSKLKKMKSTIILTEGMTYYEANFNKVEDEKIKEIMGFIEFLKLKPFTTYRRISEINGQEVHDYVSDSWTF